MPIRGRTRIGQAEIVVGFRHGRSASVYWDLDPVYQFNANGELRRVFSDGLRYAAFNGVLMRLDQSRDVHLPSHARSVTAEPAMGRLTLQPQAIAKKENSRLLDHLHRCLSQLQASLSQEDLAHWETQGESAEAFRHRLACWGDTIGVPFKIADTPAIV
jgi:hypothetical protein